MRERLIDDLRLTQEQLGVTFVYVTSDPLEALQLAKTILILHDGQIVEQGPLTEVYDKPHHLASLTTLGFPEANVIPGELKSGAFQSTVFSVKTDVNGQTGAAVAGVRPEAVMLGKQVGAVTLNARVTLLENLGSEIVAYLDVAGTQIITVVSRTDSEALKDLGAANVLISIKPEAIVIFSASTQQTIGKGTSLV